MNAEELKVVVDAYEARIDKLTQELEMVKCHSETLFIQTLCERKDGHEYIKVGNPGCQGEICMWCKKDKGVTP